MAPSPHDWKAPRPLPLPARSRGRAVAALVGPACSGAPTLAASRSLTTRVPVPGSIGASVQPCTRFGTGYGRAGVAPATLAACRLRFRSHRSAGDRSARRVTGRPAGVLGFRVDCRSRRAVSGVRRESAVVAVPAPRHLARRLRPMGEETPRLARQRASGSALGCSSLMEGAPRPQARARRSRGGRVRRRGASAVAVRCKAGHLRWNQERQRLVGRSPLRKRTPERRTRRESKRVKRRESRHPPELGRHRARGVDADPGY